MAFFDDFADAMAQYATFSVVANVVDRAPVPPATAGAINVNEVWSFRVRIANNGHLNMTKVSVGVSGSNGVLVSTSASGPFSQAIHFGALTVNGHSTKDTAKVYFKAPSDAKPPGTHLVTTSIHSFDANLNHLLTDHGGSAAQGTIIGEVYP